LGYQRGDLPLTEQCSREVLSLPFFTGLVDEELEEVAWTIQSFFDQPSLQGRRTGSEQGETH
jgi:dTDP-4-amino-4,6-dideoxygalactose transaminase